MGRVFFVGGKPGMRLPRLPSGHKELESIQSSGTQYIDTGIAYNAANKYEIEAECQWLDNSNAYTGWNAGGIFGNQGGCWGHGGSATTVSATVLTKIKLTIEAGSSGNTILEVTQNGVTQIITRAHGSIASYATMNYPIFAYTSNTGGLNGYAKMLCKWLTMKVNDTLVREFVPDLYDANVGMYDLVEGKFYGNSGSGAFIGGEEL